MDGSGFSLGWYLHPPLLCYTTVPWLRLHLLNTHECCPLNTRTQLGPTRPRPPGHYILDLANPQHEAVAHKLVELSLAQPELPNFWNIRINGAPRAVHENRNMWGTFTSETASPFMEFDFIGERGNAVTGVETKA